MTKEYSTISGPPDFMLKWASEIMGFFYPWLMRVGDVLHRLVQ